MKIISGGPRSKVSSKEIVSFTASTQEDKQALRTLYDLLHKFGSTEILVSLAESKMIEDTIEHISLVFE
jgi:hypothetical protein